MTTRTGGAGAGTGTALDAVREAYRSGTVTAVSYDGARVEVDGTRPFLVMVRDGPERAALDRLVRGEASNVRMAPGSADVDDTRIREIVEAAVRAGVRAHGTFLVIEVWAGPGLRVLGPDGPAPATVRTLADGLATLDLRNASGPEVVASRERHPPGREPILSVSECHELGALLLGVELPPVWRDPDTGTRFPVFLRRLAHDFSAVLRAAVFEFVKVQAPSAPSSYRALGPRELDAAVWEADRRLAEIDASFDPLLLVAPVNADRAWERFRDGGYAEDPEFHYRLLPMDPDLLKRRLYEVELEGVDDPAAWRLLRDKREELDRQITLLAERNTPAFLHDSIRLFGHVEPPLLDRARDILDQVPARSGRPGGERVGAEEFARRARHEFDHYRALYPAFESEVQVRPDLVGLMVSSGRLLIGRGLALRPRRVEALLQHEVGTHVLTYVNGAAQPFLQLAHGFADYDELQEGLGVLAEYLVGGLDAARMRLLAARVVAVECRLGGASFVETFRRLHGDHGFTPRTAFDIATRVYQSGGFTRDVIYLRGLVGVVEHLREGGALEPLYVGKIAARHVAIVRELQERGVLKPAPLVPRFLERESSRDRLTALRDGLPIHAMTAGEEV
ncbi:MAG: DUF1704 domain-containing protein [Gemmatimonadetes bacterium]|nr:DUF1704 domain-containing protein [Gemmatimonadota bacterium]NIQ55404.1 DUF1704 domain-containing protein [Gemmatimonadota bacterium]NIU75613.1 DUF1704 domain-containing protein [Gammaproteobacteria bacterium]NIX45295.1 DUF1704 domain-containing protein [Gemmatimonadota bacterium]NIY09582.1 DUF1704 domain-containing protein [Gemmatimonadota bacterium]